MAETKKAAEAVSIHDDETVRIEIVSKKAVNLAGRGVVFPGSVIEVKAGLAANCIKLGWAKESKEKLNLTMPDHIADQLSSGKKGSG